MFCKSNRVVKNGKQTNRQRYKCLDCGKNFQSKRRGTRFQDKLWKEYTWDKQTVIQLAEKYKKSEKWIRLQLEKVEVVKREINPQPVVIVADTTFFGREYGITVFRDPNIKKNLYWEEIGLETPLAYAEGKYFLEKKGFTVQAVVVDGKRGLKEAFKNIPVQMCQFHQIATINRYLTRRPRLEASQELRRITLSLTETDKVTFTKQLDKWYEKWELFLKEKTFNQETRKWFYTHKRVRSAYRSLNTNLSYLFTYLKHPELDIPNTTNSIEGYFSKLKCLLRIHRGLTKKRRFKVISEILNN